MTRTRNYYLYIYIYIKPKTSKYYSNYTNYRVSCINTLMLLHRYVCDTMNWLNIFPPKYSGLAWTSLPNYASWLYTWIYSIPVNFVYLTIVWCAFNFLQRGHVTRKCLVEPLSIESLIIISRRSIYNILIYRFRTHLCLRR